MNPKVPTVATGRVGAFHDVNPLSRVVWPGRELKVHLVPKPWQGFCAGQAGFGGSGALPLLKRGNTFL